MTPHTPLRVATADAAAPGTPPNGGCGIVEARRQRTYWLAEVERCQRRMDTQATRAALDRLRAATCALLLLENAQ